MNKLKKIVYEIKLKNVKNNLRRNAEQAIKEIGNKVFNGIKYNNKQTRLMVCKSYLENKLTYVRN